MSRNSHTGKSKWEKDEYKRSIKKTMNESTVPHDTSIGSRTTDVEEIDDKSGSSKPRISKSNRIRLHFADNWLFYVLGIIASVGVFFLIDAKVNIAVLNEQQIKQDGNISDNSSRLIRIEDKVSNVESSTRSLTDRFQLLVDLIKPKKE